MVSPSPFLSEVLRNGTSGVIALTTRLKCPTHLTLAFVSNGERRRIDQFDHLLLTHSA